MPDSAGTIFDDLPPAFRGLVMSIGLLRRVMDPFFARYGLSGAQWAVLRTLHRAEREGVTELHLNELGDRLLVRSPSVTHVIERLRRAGLVSRRTSVKDLRAKRVGLTPAGRQRVLDLLAAHDQQVQSILSPLSESEQAQLGLLLTKLTDHWHGLAGEADCSDEAALDAETDTAEHLSERISEQAIEPSQAAVSPGLISPGAVSPGVMEQL